jgi:uncharacterized protein YraI
MGGYLFRILAICFVVFIASFVAVQNAHADHNAYTTADVNMRTGPSVRNAIILSIPRGESVHVHGCLRGRNWCDVSWYGHRGYVYRRYLTEIVPQPYRGYVYPPDYRRYVYPPDYRGYVYPRYRYPPYFRYERDWYGDRYHEPRKKRKKYKKKKKRHDGHKNKRKSGKKWKKGSNKKKWKKKGGSKKHRKKRGRKKRKNR